MYTESQISPSYKQLCRSHNIINIICSLKKGGSRYYFFLTRSYVITSTQHKILQWKLNLESHEAYKSEGRLMCNGWIISHCFIMTPSSYSLIESGILWQFSGSLNLSKLKSLYLMMMVNMLDNNLYFNNVPNSTPVFM